jgi:hypothetical protein
MPNSRLPGLKLAGAYINEDTYKSLVALAHLNNRSLAGQIRVIYDAALRDPASTPNAPTVKKEAA